MKRGMLGAVLLAAVLLSNPTSTLACSTCFGQADGPLIDAARLGTWLLLGVVLCMQVSFAAFFFHLRRRAARLARRAEGTDSSGSPPGPRSEWRSA
jgi:threonine/homoserine/homoserine lactone efflux protein